MILSIVIFKRKFHGEKKKKMGRKRVIIYHFSDMTSTKLQKLLPYFSCFQLKKNSFFFIISVDQFIFHPFQGNEVVVLNEPH